MRLKLLMAAGITVFITALVVAITQQVLSAPTTAVSETTPLPTATMFMPTASPQATPRPVVDAEAVQQREATFQARLAAANAAIAASAAELAAAKQEQAALASKYNALAQQQQRQSAQLLMVTATPAPMLDAPQLTTTPAYASMDAVLANIQSLNPAAVLLQTPEMVMYENTVAYEFVFDTGTVYVTASDGAMLYDGIAANARAVADARRDRNPPPSGDAPPPPPGGGDGEHHHDDDDHEDHHEDHHEDDGGDDD